MGNSNSKEKNFIGLQVQEKIRMKPREGKPAGPAKRAFIVGVLGEFGSTTDATGAEGGERFINLDRYNFDDVMQAIAPGLSVEIDNCFRKGGPPLQLSLIFQHLKDFHPDSLAHKVPVLERLLEAREAADEPEKLKEILQEAGVHISTEEAAPVEEQEPGSEAPARPVHPPSASDATPKDLLDAIIEQSSSETPQRREQHPSAVLDAFIREAERPAPDRKDRAARGIMINRIDEMLERQMRAILSHPTFKRFETAWLSLFRLVREAETGPELKIKLIDMPKLKMLQDFSAADSVEKTLLYRLIYENECATPGGEPFGLLVGNYRFGPGSGDMVLLQYLAGIASLSNAPLITAAAPSLLGLKDFSDLSELSNLNHLKKEEAYSAWRSFRQSDVARRVGICLPGILLRLPYGPDTDSISTFEFAEYEGSKGPRSYLWGNPAMELGRIVTGAFARDGWDMAPRHYGTLSDLPVHVYEESGEKIARPCAEAVLKESLVGHLIEAGFIPFVPVKNTDRVIIPTIQSVARTELFGT